MSLARISIGDKVKFRRFDGLVVEDTVRAITKTTRLLMPYAPNEDVDAIVLTNHSWCELSDIVE